MLSSSACGAESIAVFYVYSFLRNPNRVYLLARIFTEHNIFYDNIVFCGLYNLEHDIT